MGRDLVNEISPAELKKEIQRILEADPRSLPENAKTFGAVAKLQGFDQLPDSVDVDEMNRLIAEGRTELNRGIAPTKGVPASFYARELIAGTLYPGTLIAYGQGIYLAETSQEYRSAVLPRISEVATFYAQMGDDVGAIVRCALRKSAKKVDKVDLIECYREHRNRARRAGLTDLGTFAAAMGYDCYSCDGIHPNRNEQVWVVVNRTALIFQKVGLQTALIARHSQSHGNAT